MTHVHYQFDQYELDTIFVAITSYTNDIGLKPPSLAYYPPPNTGDGDDGGDDSGSGGHLGHHSPPFWKGLEIQLKLLRVICTQDLKRAGVTHVHYRFDQYEVDTMFVAIT
jgi:hypothetical protein